MSLTLVPILPVGLKLLQKYQISLLKGGLCSDFCDLTHGGRKGDPLFQYPLLFGC